MVKIWAFFLIALFLGINAADSSHSQPNFENNQTASICKLLSGSSLKKLTLTNDLNGPVKLLVVSQLVIKTTPGIPHRINAPDGWNLITWNTLDEKCFPVVNSQVKHLRLMNYAGTPSFVHAVQAITLESKKSQILTTPQHYSFSHLANAPDEQGFINIDTLEEDLKLIIQPTCRSFWAASARDYDFLRCAFQGDVGWPFLADFRDKILPQAGIDPTTFYQKIGSCYANYQQLVAHEKPTQNPRIPLTIHTIWLSDESNPVEPKSEYSDWLAETMQVCPPEQGWQYILWVNCENMTVSKHPLAGMPNRALVDRLERFIEVKHVNTLPQYTQWFKIFESFLRQKNYGAASDVLRLIILKATGGVYRDTDFKFTQSPLVLNKLLDFYSGMESPQAIAACNAMIACKPNHPVIDEALDLIVKGASPSTCPDFLHPYTKMVYRTLLHTGPMMFGMAFYKGAKQGRNRDVLFPPDFFFGPASAKSGFSKLPIQTAGIHYHEKAWL